MKFKKIKYLRYLNYSKHRGIFLFDELFHNFHRNTPFLHVQASITSIKQSTKLSRVGKICYFLRFGRTERNFLEQIENTANFFSVQNKICDVYLYANSFDEILPMTVQLYSIFFGLKK
ncbi:hypothetical protein RFI_25865 [Reticulomyxa filosa]|uniref:Uncharacterized protein n=1 Tax=Reticulomyxa filosa TaxID=46433 RepID=X6MCX4_RETFI|nr:hypothetical protein RFI_25865 [Reticulomyxa filosa]|eukprot:ETO11511.1 hypothetical protein RFI_25865 [Reticulomyxa filosa]